MTEFEDNKMNQTNLKAYCKNTFDLNQNCMYQIIGPKQDKKKKVGEIILIIYVTFNYEYFVFNELILVF